MTTYSATLHIKETYEHPVYGRIFDGWVECDAPVTIFDNAHYSMTSSQAIAYKVAAEKRAWEWSHAAKISAETGQPSKSVVELAYAPDFLK